MADELEPSPFAEFAVPKKSAVEALRQRQAQSRRLRQQTIHASGCIIAGAAVAASGAIAIREGMASFPVVLGAALLGGVLGLLLGLLIGAVGYWLVTMSRTPLGPESMGRATGLIMIMRAPHATGNESLSTDRASTAMMTAVIVACGLIGAGAGAAGGGLQGASWFLGKAVGRADGLAAMAGGFVGAGLAGIGWLWWIRSRRRDSATTEFTVPSSEDKNRER